VEPSIVVGLENLAVEAGYHSIGSEAEVAFGMLAVEIYVDGPSKGLEAVGNIPKLLKRT
jgi:hypothetical protein